MAARARNDAITNASIELNNEAEICCPLGTPLERAPRIIFRVDAPLMRRAHTPRPPPPPPVPLP